MNAHKLLLPAVVALGLLFLGACDNNNGRVAVVEPTPAPFVPTNEEEALSVSDEDYDYAAAFANSGRGGF